LHFNLRFLSYFNVARNFNFLFKGEAFTTIQIRLPNGSRLQRKFSLSHTLQVSFCLCLLLLLIFCFVQCILKSDICVPSILQLVIDFIEGYIAQVLDDTTFIDDATSSLEDDNVIPWSIHSYELINNFPKRKFSKEDFDKTLQQLGLVPQVLLYLQEKIPSSD
jgi:hypothetical protein